LKNQSLDPNKILELIGQIENMAGAPQFDLSQEEETKVNIRVDEKVAPAMFKKDPLLIDGYVANSLTIRAMRKNIFILGTSLEDFSTPYNCPCGKDLDAQFWKLCPYCGKEIHL
jgi:hypothetical protein